MRICAGVSDDWSSRNNIVAPLRYLEFKMTRIGNAAFKSNFRIPLRKSMPKMLGRLTEALPRGTAD